MNGSAFDCGENFPFSKICVRSREQVHEVLDGEIRRGCISSRWMLHEKEYQGRLICSLCSHVSVDIKLWCFSQVHGEENNLKFICAVCEKF